MKPYQTITTMRRPLNDDDIAEGNILWEALALAFCIGVLVYVGWPFLEALS